MYPLYRLQTAYAMYDFAIMSNDKSTSITFRLDHETAAKLKALAERDQRTISQYVRLLVSRHVVENTRVKPSSR